MDPFMSHFLESPEISAIQFSPKKRLENFTTKISGVFFKPTVKSPQQWLMNGIPIMNYYNPKCMVHSVASFSTLPGLLKLLSSFYQDVPQRHHLRYKFDA